LVTFSFEYSVDYMSTELTVIGVLVVCLISANSILWCSPNRYSTDYKKLCNCMSTYC